MEIAFRSQHDDPSASGIDRTWTRCRIGKVGLVITRTADSTLRVDPAGIGYPGDEVAEPMALLLPHGDGDLSSAVMLLPSGKSYGPTLLLNGFPPLSVTELSAGAEISIGAESLFYHNTRRALSEIFDSGEIEHCTRCRRSFSRGDEIRRCGVCLSPYHEGKTADPQLPDLACASYDPQCARCRSTVDSSESSTPNTEHHPTEHHPDGD